MDYDTLRAAMGRTVPVAYTAPFNQALIQAGCNTVNRVAMFCAQVGHESGGLLWTQELASGSAYEGRRDLGNTQRGDGVRFKGRGILQVTGRAHYGEFGAWCYRRGLVDSPSYFISNPPALAALPWSFLSAAWYWTDERPDLNAVSDRGDYVTATRRVNGGTNGLDDRRIRWNRCRALGARLLPTGTSEEDDMTPEQARKLDEVHAVLTMLLKPWLGGVSDKEPVRPEDPNVAGYNGLQYLLRNNVEIHQLRNQVTRLEAKLEAKS